MKTISAEILLNFLSYIHLYTYITYIFTYLHITSCPVTSGLYGWLFLSMLTTLAKPSNSLRPGPRAESEEGSTLFGLVFDVGGMLWILIALGLFADVWGFNLNGWLIKMLARSCKAKVLSANISS